MVERVDYDRYQHAVYQRGRALTPEIAQLWVGVLGRYLGASSHPAVVDLGSGTGMYSRLLAEELGATVAGVEPSERMRAVAERENPHPRVRYLDGSAERIPLAEKSCDAALLSNSLHHVDDRTACVKELARVVRPDGVVLVRGTLRESLDHVPWLDYFPAARPVAERQMPSRDEVVSAFTASLFEHAASEVIEQETAPSLRVYYERVSQRAISTLELIDDDEFERGVARMCEAAERETAARPVIEHVDLVVLRRRA